MNNDLENRKRKLEKKKKLTYWLMFVGYFLSFSVSANGLSIVLPMTEFMLILLDVNNINRDIILSVMEFFFRYLPTIVYVGGKIKMSSISEEILELKRIDETKEDMYGDLLKEISVGEKIKDEEEILKVYDIVERFEMLPRDKQMEVLNYIKGDLSIEDNQLCIQIKELKDEYKNVLQTECEDVLFPDFKEDEIGYTKNRRK